MRKKILVILALAATAVGFSILLNPASTWACPYPDKNLPPDPNDPRNYTPACSPFETTTSSTTTTTTIPVITTIGGPADVTTTSVDSTTTSSTVVEDTTTTSSTVPGTLPRTGSDNSDYHPWMIGACFVIVVGGSMILVRARR